MNQTHIDYLFQAVVPRGDLPRSASGRTGSAEPAFEDHLSQASAVTRDEPPGVVTQDVTSHYGTESCSGSTCDSPVGSRDSISDPSNCNGQETPAADAQTAAENNSASASDEQAGSVKQTHAEQDDGGDTDDDKTDAKDAPQLVCGAVVNNGEAVRLGLTIAPTDAGPVEPIQNASAKSTTQIDEKAIESVTPETPISLEILSATEAATEMAANAISDAAITTSTGEQIAVSSNRSKKGKQSNSANDPGATDSRNSRDVEAGKRGRMTTTNAAARVELVANPTGENHPGAEQESTRERSSDSTSNDEPRGVARPSSRSVSRADSDSAAATRATAVANGVTTNRDTTTASTVEIKDGAPQTAKAVGPPSDPTASTLTRMARSSAGTNRGGRASNTNDAPKVDPARFVGRVAKAFQTANDRGGTLHLRLSPPELGSLRLELTVKDGVMTATMETETAAARRVLLDHMPALRDRLAEQNIRVDRFDVEVRHEGGGSQPDPRASQQQQQQQTPPRRSASTRQTAANATRSAPVTSPPRPNNGEINLVA
jgi:flagellar hook-length control protein FliK